MTMDHIVKYYIYIYIRCAMTISINIICKYHHTNIATEININTLINNEQQDIAKHISSLVSQFASSHLQFN